MKNILLVEDNSDKRHNIITLLNEYFQDITIDEAYSFGGALKKIVQKHSSYSLMILDMTMPNYDFSPTEPSGGGPESYAGKELLSQMKLRKIKIPTVVLTMFDSFDDKSTKLTLTDLQHQLKESFSPMYLATIYYNSAQDLWKEELISLVKGLISE